MCGWWFINEITPPVFWYPNIGVRLNCLNNCQLPTANCQQPTANCQQPTANCPSQNHKFNNILHRHGANILHGDGAILLVGKNTDQQLWSDDGPIMCLVPFGRFCTLYPPRSHKFQGPLKVYRFMWMIENKIYWKKIFPPKLLWGKYFFRL